MGTRTPRRLAIAALLVFVGFVAYHSVTSYGWSGDLATPAGVKAESVSFTCGPFWGSGYVHGPSSTAYPVQGTPCQDRNSGRLMSSLDVVGGGLALVLLVSWDRIRRRPVAPIAGRTAS